VVATVRDENIGACSHLDPRIFLTQAGSESIQVGLFDDEEAKQIGWQFPALKALLSTSGLLGKSCAGHFSFAFGGRVPRGSRVNVLVRDRTYRNMWARAVRRLPADARKTAAVY